MSATSFTQLLTDQEQSRFASLIYDRTGIRIPPAKKTLLSNRLRKLVRALKLDSFSEYYRYVEKLPASHPDWDAFLQEITTHETYLFRDMNQWNWFRDEYLPQIQQEARKGERPQSLRIWSAACSTGDEPHTIACCLADRLTNASAWRIEILATDIGVGALEHARAGVFGERAMQHVTESYRRRFFNAIDGNRWQAKPCLTQWLRFQQHNLMEPIRGAAFDLIILKNVLIYFDPPSKRQVFGHLDRALKRRGLLVSGPAEGMGELLKDYERIQTWLHRKP